MTTSSRATIADTRWQTLLDAGHLEQIIQAMPGGLLWVDGHGVVSRANPAALALLGEPLLATPWVEVIARAFSPRPDDGFQVSLKDGRRVQLAISHLEGRPGQLIQLTDMTPTRTWAEQQGHAQRLAALGHMAATLAHQIRTPLSAAMLYGANLSSPALSEGQRQQFQQRLVARLQDIERQISDILMFARQEQSPLADELEVATLLEQSREAATPLLAARGVALEITGPGSGRILGNGNSLKSILLNLMENAAEAGASRISLESEVEQQQVVIRVRDNGKGMDETLSAKIFAPFFTTRSQGTGLGLAAVAAVARAHQGRVTVASAPGRGSCFSLWLPLLANNVDG
ncbi:sensor histidine kinase [Zobellella iuensis]|uniref:histidine kinase n=1 Tax=Zobellella iuensis TaxID=2803811 RepID=A0ABS1QVB2_9GAMM|nr:HAMP domain-containing sensor histidine kinase [Zobellella iuensis]MBL1378391.1 HAMP domain-containing histidine kinase [Zobellella iuensis]